MEETSAQFSRFFACLSSSTFPYCEETCQADSHDSENGEDREGRKRGKEADSREHDESAESKTDAHEALVQAAMFSLRVALRHRIEEGRLIEQTQAQSEDDLPRHEHKEIRRENNRCEAQNSQEEHSAEQSPVVMPTCPTSKNLKAADTNIEP